MPFTTLRLNEKHLHPNPRITFIKPLPSLTTTPLAKLFLQKIAAQCYPIMKAHSLSITTLEEFPPNREFWGRNFNGGEVIQLVLRRMPTRRWDDARAQFVSTSDLGENGVVVRGNRGRLDPHSTEFVAERDGQDEGWLGFKAVQAVMMHELAHCAEMNHAKAFWKVRNVYMEHLKVLWREG
ncbi:WLM domain-containing protein, partial [Elsinoe ampelina]